MILVYGWIAAGEYSCILAFDDEAQANRFFELQNMTGRDDVSDWKAPRVTITKEEFEEEAAGKKDWYNRFFKGVTRVSA